MTKKHKSPVLFDTGLLTYKLLISLIDGENTMNDLINNTINLFLKEPVFLIIIILGIFSSIFYKKIRGFMGEFWVKMELKKLPKNEYIVLNDIMIKSSKGTHQIDHIIISEFGIFVIEMKNYFGLIIGDENKNKWIQYLGSNKYYFNNPIHQNYGHIKALQELLNLSGNKFVSIVCFSNQVQLKVNVKNVTQLDFINKLIQSYSEKIINENIIKIKNLIEENNIKDRIIRKQHIDTIKAKIKEKNNKEKDMICPRCGSQLVECNGKYGKFIGCSNYPNCKYTSK